MKKTLILLSAVATLAGSPALYADEEAPALSTTLTLGYDSRYVLYGYRLSRHLYHADVYLYYPLDEKTSLWGGAWYGYLTDGTYHEVDVYGGVDRMLTDTLSVGAAYSLFNYLDVPFTEADNAQEYAVHVSYARGPLWLSLRGQYDTEAKGTLVRGIAAISQPVNEQLSLAVEAEGGYAFEYYIDKNLWNHAQVKVKAPWQVSDRLTLMPFVMRSIPLAALDDFEQYETVYGISASTSF